MDNYSIRVGVETVGEDKLRTIYDAIKGNQNALQSLSPHLQGYVRDVITGVNETQNFGKALKNMHLGITGASDEFQGLTGALRVYIAETKAAENAAKKTGDAIQHTVPQMAAASAALRTLEGQMSIRAAERFLAMFQGLGPVLQAAFPVFGAIAFFEAIERGVDSIGKMYNAWNPVIKAQKESLKLMQDSDREFDKLIAQSERLRLEEGKRRFGVQFEYREQKENAELDAKEAQRTIEHLQGEKAKQQAIFNRGNIPAVSDEEARKLGMEGGGTPAMQTPDARAAAIKIADIDRLIEEAKAKIEKATLESGKAQADSTKDYADKARELAKKIREIHREEEISQERMETLKEKTRYGTGPEAQVELELLAEKRRYEREQKDMQEKIADNKLGGPDTVRVPDKVFADQLAQQENEHLANVLSLSKKLFDAQDKTVEAAKKELDKYYEEELNKFHSAVDAQARDFERMQNEQFREEEHDVRQRLEVQKANEGVDVAGAKQAAAQRQATSRLLGIRNDLSPGQIAEMQLKDSLAAIQAEDDAKRAGLRERKATLDAAIGEHGLNPNVDQWRADSEKIEKELAQLDIEQKTKSIDALSKFNDAIETSIKTVRDTLGSGFESLVMGAQRGGGKGASNAIRSFAEQQEAQILKNIGTHLLGGVAGSLGVSQDSKLAPFLKGTIFGANPQEKALNDNNVKTEANTVATEKLTDMYQQLANGGGGMGSGGSYGGGGVGSLPLGGRSVLGDIGTIASLGSSLGGGSMSSVGKVLSTLGSVISGTKYVGDIAAPFTGQYHAPGGGFAKNLSTSERVGAAAADIGAAVAAYQGIRTATHGGAKNVIGGIGETLGAVAMFTGPAAPFVAAAGALAGLVSAFLPDNRARRSAQIEKTLFTQQYMAPPAENIGVGANGGYSDTDAFGNVRNSHFSPYPVVSNSYLDVPRRTVVPGHTVGSFGGYSNVTGAKPTAPPPSTVTIHVHGTVVDAHNVLDLAHKGLQSGSHPIVHTLSQQLGTRS